MSRHSRARGARLPARPSQAADVACLLPPVAALLWRLPCRWALSPPPACSSSGASCSSPASAASRSSCCWPSLPRPSPWRRRCRWGGTGTGDTVGPPRAEWECSSSDACGGAAAQPGAQRGCTGPPPAPARQTVRCCPLPLPAEFDDSHFHCGWWQGVAAAALHMPMPPRARAAQPRPWPPPRLTALPSCPKTFADRLGLHRFPRQPGRRLAGGVLGQPSDLLSAGEGLRTAGRAAQEGGHQAGACRPPCMAARSPAAAPGPHPAGSSTPRRTWGAAARRPWW